MNSSKTSKAVSSTQRIVIVGASLAGLSAAEALRAEGFSGALTVIGDEPHAPYDRPPLSKTVLTGRLPVEHTTLPQSFDLQARWLLGVPGHSHGAGGDQSARLCRAYLSDGDVSEVEVGVVALGAVRNVEWLQGSGLVFDARGIVCDAACRVFDTNGMITDDIFVAGDVARWPHPLYKGDDHQRYAYIIEASRCL